jgi:tRNA dimethylallyltransferase
VNIELPAEPVAILGPTASGKSWLAMEIARRIPDVELVSIDSMQVYRTMDIGTAKPSPTERAEVVHHMLDLVDPDKDFDLSQSQAITLSVLSDIAGRGKRAVLVGGTGLYLQAITDGLELPGRFPDVRCEVERNVDTAALYGQLSRLDPVAAARMEPSNRRRIVRALEVTIGSGRPFSSFGPGVGAFPDTNVRLMGVWLPRPRAGELIDERVDSMVEHGWLQEVAQLRSTFELSKTAAQALGYKELLRHLDGSGLTDEIEEIKRRTRSFARRQRVWFRRDPRIRWYGTDVDSRRLLPAMLQDCRQHWEVKQT